MRRTVFASATGAALIAGAGLALAHAGHAQIPPPTVKFAAHSQTIPFELFRGNRIVIPARINGHETRVLLDTGASATTVDRAYARSIGFPEGMKIQGKGSGGTVEAELVSGVTIDLGGVRLDKMNVGVMDLAPVSRGLGRPLTVVLGRDFFNSAVVSIDWAAGALQVRSPQSFTPGKDAARLNLTRKGPFNTIPVSVAGGEPIQALLDVGNGGALALPRTYWSKRPDLAALRSAETRMGGVGGLNAARAVVMPKVTLAGQSFTNVPTMLSEVGSDDEPTQMANVGIGLLKQFTVDLDLGRDRIYLTPRHDAPPFERDRSGARFDLIGDRLKVVFVSPQGPAAAAGLKDGDEVVAVDGQPVSADYYSAPDWTRGPVGKTVALERGDGTKVTITLQDYY